MTTLIQWLSGSGFIPSGATLTGGASVVSGNDGLGMGDCIRLPAGSTAAFLQNDVGFANTDVVRGRFYFDTPSAWPSSAHNMVAFRPNSSTTAFGFATSGAGAPGQFRVVGTGGALLAQSGNNTLALSSIYRADFEITGSGASRKIRARVYSFGSATAIYDTGEITLPTASDVAITRVDIGKVNNSPATERLHMDSVLITLNEATTPGPDAADPALPEPEPSFEWVGVPADDASLQGADIVRTSGGLDPASNGVFSINQSGGLGYIESVIGASEYVGVRGYFKLSAWPSGAFALLTLRPSPSTVIAAATLSGSGQPGQLRLTTLGGSTVVSTANNTVALDTWYRVELHYNKGSGARVALFRRGKDHVVWDSGWLNDANFTSDVTHVQMGRVTLNPQVQIEIDSLLVRTEDDGDWIGRDTTDDPLIPATPLQAAVWDGSTLTPVSLSLQTGSGSNTVNPVLWDGFESRPIL